MRLYFFPLRSPFPLPAQNPGGDFFRYSSNFFHPNSHDTTLKLPESYCMIEKMAETFNTVEKEQNHDS